MIASGALNCGSSLRVCSTAIADVCWQGSRHHHDEVCRVASGGEGAASGRRPVQGTLVKCLALINGAFRIHRLHQACRILPYLLETDTARVAFVLIYGLAGLPTPHGFASDVAPVLNVTGSSGRRRGRIHVRSPSAEGWWAPGPMLRRLEQNYGHLREELLWGLLSDALEVIVPPASFEVDATHEGTIAGKSDRQAALPRRPLVVYLLLVVRWILLVYEVK